MTFDEAFHKLLGHEGGYSNHPDDTGGETMWGVTYAVARAHGYTGQMSDLPVDVAKSIYRASYWDAVRADELPEQIKYPMFDAAVNSGVKQAVLWLQRAVRVKDDGILGPQTMLAAKTQNPDVLRCRLLSQRLRFMSGLPSWPAFGRGWARRISDLLEA